MVLQLSRRKKECVSLLKVMQLRISGTWMKQGLFEKPFQSVGLHRKELHVMVGRN